MNLDFDISKELVGELLGTFQDPVVKRREKRNQRPPQGEFHWTNPVSVFPNNVLSAKEEAQLVLNANSVKSTFILNVWHNIMVGSKHIKSSKSGW